jgi:hypothetical protein
MLIISENTRSLEPSKLKPNFDQPNEDLTVGQPVKFDFIHVMKAVSLDEISSVHLMNRQDTKYILSESQLISLMPLVTGKYFILEIGGQRVMTYETLYYDSFNQDFFLSHVNGKLNRSKVRRRSYMESDLHFLEVKRKTNKDKTIKKRIQISAGNGPFTEEAIDLVQKYSNTNLLLLSPILINRFKRITLANMELTERVTIDFELIFQKSGEEKPFGLNNLVIIEIKQEKAGHSHIKEVLSGFRFKKTGLSKYCIGMALTGLGKKINILKKKIKQIQKITHHEYAA